MSVGEVPESIPNINDRDNSEENPYASSSFEGEAENIKATLLVSSYGCTLSKSKLHIKSHYSTFGFLQVPGQVSDRIDVE